MSSELFETVYAIKRSGFVAFRQSRIVKDGIDEIIGRPFMRHNRLTNMNQLLGLFTNDRHPEHLPGRLDGVDTEFFDETPASYSPTTLFGPLNFQGIPANDRVTFLGSSIDGLETNRITLSNFLQPKTISLSSPRSSLMATSSWVFPPLANSPCSASRWTSSLRGGFAHPRARLSTQTQIPSHT